MSQVIITVAAFVATACYIRHKADEVKRHTGSELQKISQKLSSHCNCIDAKLDGVKRDTSAIPHIKANVDGLRLEADKGLLEQWYTILEEQKDVQDIVMQAKQTFRMNADLATIEMREKYRALLNRIQAGETVSAIAKSLSDDHHTVRTSEVSSFIDAGTSQCWDQPQATVPEVSTSANSQPTTATHTCDGSCEHCSDCQE